jgi:hypothetical protein
MGYYYYFYYKPYIAIIGDIVQSKKLINRYEIQDKLQEVLNKVNKKYSEDIASNFMITLGDEFQGLLENGKNTMKIVTEIEDEMYPVEIRYGIGVGEITTDIKRDSPFGSDGSAYHNARKMIDKLKSMEKMKKAINSNMMITSEGDNAKTDLLLNSILSLCFTIKQKWSKRKREIILEVIRHNDNQSKAAEEIGVSQGSIHKALDRAGYYSYKDAMDLVSEVLSEVKADKDV